MNVPNEASLPGSNQLDEMLMCPAGAEPAPSLTSATTESTISITTSTATRMTCMRAEISIPR